MTDLKKLKQLVQLMVENDLTELDLGGDGEHVRLRRQGKDIAPVVMQQAPAAMPAPVSQAPVAGDGTAADPAKPTKSDAVTIDSPMVGTFYHASSPDAEPFVSVGDRVTADSNVCIIEAMKVFNEIKAEQAGVIKAVLVENGQPVEFGQPLFEIDPKG